ncbi:MAG: trypsin-like peptidase domain-containing protein [Nitrospinota bacterium]
MDSKENLSCGKDLRKFLYVIGFVSIFLLIGSYWYMEYYLNGRGFGNSGLQHQGGGAADAQAATPLDAAGMQPVTAPFQVPMTVATRSPFTVVAGALKRSVVNISATRSGRSPMAGRASPPQGNGQDMRFADPFSGTGVESIGSGIILSSDGYILTNFHVVENATEVYANVFGPQGSKRYHAEVIRLGEAVDLALLKIKPDTPLIPAALGDSEQIAVGDQVLAIGSPFGLDQTVSQGIVSSMRKTMMIEGVTHRNLIQTDAAINQGNSGGPLVNINGYVIGINTAIYTPTGAFAGIGFAVPSNNAREFIDEVITLKRVRPNLKSAFRQKAGFVNAATNIAPPIPANAKLPHAYVGPCEGCHQVLPSGQYPGQTQGDVNQFAIGPGGAIGMNAALATGATKQKAETLRLWLGADVQPIDRVVAKYFKSPFTYGAFVNNVYTGSPSEKAGLLSGDIVFKMDGRWVYSSDDLAERLANYSKGDEVRLSIFRGGSKQDIYLTLGMKPAGVTPALLPMPGRGKGAPVNRPPVISQVAALQRLAMPPNGQGNALGIVPKEFEWIGLETDPINGAIVKDHPRLSGKKGALVIEVEPGTKGAMAGLLPRDIIISVNRMPVDSAKALYDAINLIDPKKGILLEVERKNKRMYTVVR